MKDLQLNGKRVQVYDSIDEMPIVNFQKYNKYILLDAGLGSDIDSVDGHIVTIAKLINSDDKAKAMQELQNMRQNLHMIVSNVSPKHMAFAALIHSIDGVKVTNLSDSNLQHLLDGLNETKRSKIVDFLIWLKKKLYTELETYFPQQFENAREKEVYDKLKQKTLLMLDGIIEDKDNSDEIAKIDSYLFSLYKPKVFTGKESSEIKYDKQFENACLIISQKTNMDAKQMTVLQFYNALGTIDEQTKAQIKAYKNHK